MKNNMWKWLFYSILFTFCISVLIACGITFFGWFSWSAGDANGWLGFWGSFLGGIIGTLSVLYVAFSQDSKQEKLILDERQILLLKYQQDEIKDVLMELTMYRNKMIIHANRCNDILANIFTDYSEGEYYNARMESVETSERNIVKKEISKIYNDFNVIKVKLKLYDDKINTDLLEPTNEPIDIFAENSLEKYRKCFSRINQEGIILSYKNILDEIDKLYVEISGVQVKARKDLITKLSTH
ncbi:MULTISPECIES: hypothetical protein [unclassified Mammaliicoccus]|uniref:hypothetical protein n=1 Tax=unclassified Mammaliicoccus TaxID=2803851 RepID=UPI00194E533E|nr:MULTISPECIES: hypothetical protein [unclassified Mammaliicoccus]